MPAKTLSEKVDELSRFVNILSTRTDYLGEDVASVRAELTALTAAHAALTTRVALLEHQVGEVRKMQDEAARRLWVIGGALFVAIIGAIGQSC